MSPPDERPTIPVPRPTRDEVMALRLDRYRRESERRIALRQDLLGMGADALELDWNAAT
jgi:hypothetical protein